MPAISSRQLSISHHLALLALSLLLAAVLSIGGCLEEGDSDNNWDKDDATDGDEDLNLEKESQKETVALTENNLQFHGARPTPARMEQAFISLIRQMEGRGKEV